jgi:hypothetical protein
MDFETGPRVRPKENAIFSEADELRFWCTIFALFYKAQAKNQKDKYHRPLTSKGLHRFLNNCAYNGLTAIANRSL